ncbi:MULTISPECIES: KPN_01571 family protein [Enterobacter cloacae complex]
MNPYLWVFIVLLALDALREDLGLSSFSSLTDYVYAWGVSWLY